MKHYGDITYKIYEYVFPNGKIYVGMTRQTLGNRRDCGYNHNPKLKEAIRLAGWRNINKVILADNLSREEACAEEMRFIKELCATDPNKGFNISHGGASTFAGLKHTDEYKKRMSDLQRGKVFSAETRRRLKEARARQRKPVRMYLENGNEEKVFDSLHDAAKEVLGYPTNIRRACESGKAYKGYLWAIERR